MADTASTSSFDVITRVEVLTLNKGRTAALLDVPVDTVCHLERTGQLKGVKVGKHLRFRLTDVRAFVEGLAPNRE